MNDRKQRADHQREDRDRFGTAGDRSAPLGPVTLKIAEIRVPRRDADPENEVGYVQRPETGRLIPKHPTLASDTRALRRRKHQESAR